MERLQVERRVLDVVALGTDIIEIERIERLCREHGEAFLDRVFTEAERAYCDGKKASYEHYAGRFAAKEAVLKVLDAGNDIGANWQELEVVKSLSGRPEVRLHGAAKERADALGIDGWHLSISHSRTNAVAVALAVRGESSSTA